MPPANHDAILLEVQRFQEQFVQCHQFMADNTYRLAELLREAESRGILLQDAFALADVAYWLENIDWQTKFLGVVLAFAQDPSRKTLRPLIELYGRERERMKVETEILERQLSYRLEKFAKPDDAFELNDVADRCPAVTEELAALAGADPSQAWTVPLSNAARNGV